MHKKLILATFFASFAVAAAAQTKYFIVVAAPGLTAGVPVVSQRISAPTLMGIASISPESLSFGVQQVGTVSAVQAVTVTNTGTAPLALSGVGLSAGGADFAQSNNCATVPVGGACTVNVSFSPKATGNSVGTLSFVHNGGGLAALPLSGAGYVGISQYATYRAWSDGTLAKSCKDYRVAAANFSYSGAVGNGLYRIIGGEGAGDVYCDMTTDGGGWTLVARSAPSGSAPGQFGWYGKTGTAANASNPYSMGVMNSTLPFTETMFGGGDYVYKHQLSRTGVSSSTNSSLSLGNPVAISPLASITFVMADNVGFTSASINSYFFRDMPSAPDSYGLRAEGWATAYGSGALTISGQAANAAYGGYLNGSQGFLFVR